MEQQPLVSVIIPGFEDDTYLVRCINSIKRQTYKNVEIIVLKNAELSKSENISGLRTLAIDNYWKGLNTAIEQAFGEKILFCHVDSVLDIQLLEKLVCNNTAEAFCFAQCQRPQGKNFTDITHNELTLYGKLFDKRLILQSNICFDSGECFPEISFLCAYVHNFREIHLVENCFVYGESEDIFLNIFNNSTVSSGIVQFLSELNSEYPLDKQAVYYLIDHAPDSLEGKVWIELAITAEDIFHNFKIDYSIAEKYLCSTFKTCLDLKDHQLFESFKKYFSTFRGNSQFLKILYPLFDLNEERFNILLSSSLDEYLFYENKLTVDQNYSALEKKIDDLSKKLNHLENITNKTNAATLLKNKIPGNTASAQKEGNSLASLTGPALSDNVISQ